MKRRRIRGAKLLADINITPLTDVALSLLLIFMVAAPVFYQSSIQVRLPKASVDAKPPRTLTVTIAANGEVLLGKQPYRLPADADAFLARLIKLAPDGIDSSIVINGDREVRYDSVVRVIDTALQAGLTRIVLATEHEKGKEKGKK